MREVCCKLVPPSLFKHKGMGYHTGRAPHHEMHLTVRPRPAAQPGPGQWLMPKIFLAAGGSVDVVISKQLPQLPQGVVERLGFPCGRYLLVILGDHSHMIKNDQPLTIKSY